MRVSEKDLELLDMEYFLEREAIPFKIGHGSSGMQINIRDCPGCGDDRYRVYMGLESGLWNCFKCSDKGRSHKFIHRFLGGDDNSGWANTFRYIEELLKEQGWRPKRTISAAVIENTVTLPLSQPIPDEAGDVMPYLAMRGMSAEDCKYFHLRYCEFGWWRFQEYADGPFEVQNFQKRVIIPVFDLDGELKTFQGRDITGLSDRKYLFPKALPGTGRYLLNGHNFMASNHACMGEGFFDVAAIKMAFDAEPELRDIVPVGSFGKHLSHGDPAGNDQLGRFHALKGRGLKHLTIMWDGEVSALDAALTAAKLISGIGIKVRIALLPFEKDPNEVTADVVVKAFRSAHPWSPALDIRWRLQNPYSSPASRKRFGV